MQTHEGIQAFRYHDDFYDTDLWTRAEGVDVVCIRDRLALRDLYAWRIDNSRWDSIDAEVAAAEPLVLGDEFPLIASRGKHWSDDDGPHDIVTFLFTTREGANGILQFFPFDAQQQHRVRYRLWNDDTSKPQPVAEANEYGEVWPAERSVTLQTQGPNLKFAANLNKGFAMPVPADVFAMGPESILAAAWFRKNRCDLRTRPAIVDDFPARDRSNPDAPIPQFIVLEVVGRQMSTVPISEQGYADLTVAQVRDLMSRWPHRRDWASLDGSRGNRRAFLEGNSCIHAFLTESGQVGLLRYTVARGDLQSVTVHYRVSDTARDGIDQ